MEKYGVSRITAIHALKELENDGYIERRWGKGNFVISTLPQSKNTISDNTVGLVIPFLVYPHTQVEHFQYVLGAIERLSKDNFRAAIYTRNDLFNERALLLKAKLDNCVGIICYPEVLKYINDILLSFTDENYPLVMLDDSDPSIPAPLVCCDNFNESRLLVEKLIKLFPVEE